MKKMILSTLFATLLYLLNIPCSFGSTSYSSANGASQKVFQKGENLSYDLYFKYGIIFAKAGYANMSISSDGGSRYLMRLISHSTGAARKAFSLDDTLSCVMDKALRPLSFAKDAHEGKDHTIERHTYRYLPAGGVEIDAYRIKNGRERYNTTFVADGHTYDMLSVVYFARTLDYEELAKSGYQTVSFLSGRKMLEMDIRYDGTTTLKANDGRRYDCYKLTLSIRDDAFSNPQEAMKVWLTGDANRVPIQIESKLKVGATRAVLKSFTGLANK